MDDRERQYRSMLLDVRADIDHAWYKAFATHHPTLASDLKEASARITEFLHDMWLDQPGAPNIAPVMDTHRVDL